MQNFSSLVEIAIAPNSDLEHSVRGLLMFALENATEEDQNEFLSWLDGGSILQINTASTRPEDHFEAANGLTWAQMETYYSENK